MWNEYKVCESWYSDSLKPQRDECISAFCCIPSSTIFSPTYIFHLFQVYPRAGKIPALYSKGNQGGGSFSFSRNTYWHLPALGCVLGLGRAGRKGRNAQMDKHTFSGVSSPLNEIQGIQSTICWGSMHGGVLPRKALTAWLSIQQYLDTQTSGCRIPVAFPHLQS